MIVKVKGYKSVAAVRNLIAYAMDDRKRIFDKNGRSFVLTNNLKGQTIEEWAREFKENEKHRIHNRKNNVKITQEIIAFHKGDTKMLTLKKMEKIARQYMRLRNTNAVYVAVPHFDKEHPHIHIVAAAVEYHSGKSLSMSRGKFMQLKKDIQAYQIEKFPELARSVVRHGRRKKTRLTDREYQYRLRTGSHTKREEIIELVTRCLRDANSPEEFLNRMAAENVQTYSRNGKTIGVIRHGRKYRFKQLGVELLKPSHRHRRLSKTVEQSMPHRDPSLYFI